MSAYIELDHGVRSPPFSDPVQVHSLTEGSFAFGKDYEVFAALAGGRGAAMARETGIRALRRCSPHGAWLRRAAGRPAGTTSASSRTRPTCPTPTSGPSGVALRQRWPLSGCGTKAATR